MSEQQCAVCEGDAARHVDVHAVGGRYPCCGGELCCDDGARGWTQEPLPSLVAPPPTASEHPAVWGLVVADMRERDADGRAKYGTPLQPHNGRDALVDAYQEALDLAVYLRTAIYERDGR